MSSWKLNASKVFAFCLLSLALLNPTHGLAEKGVEPVAVTSEMKMVLVGIRSFSETQKIKQSVSQCVGVSQVRVDSVTPGLITLHVNHSGESKAVVDQWKTLFEGKYELAEKSLPTGEIEIDLSPKF